MRFQNGNISYQFGSSISPLGKNLLIIYAVIYIAELIFEHWLHLPIVKHLMIHPLQDPDFKLWQIITHNLIHDPTSPFAFLINCLVFYFFASPVESAFGSKGFLIVFYLSAFGGLLAGLALSGISGFTMPFSGIMPGILALIVIFGLLNPESTILLMFIIPVKAKYLSYGTILITVLTFLAKANPYGAYHLGGIFTGILYYKYPHIFNARTLHLKYLQWKLKKNKAKFTVINGGATKNDDKPTYH